MQKEITKETVHREMEPILRRCGQSTDSTHAGVCTFIDLYPYTRPGIYPQDLSSEFILREIEHIHRHFSIA